MEEAGVSVSGVRRDRELRMLLVELGVVLREPGVSVRFSFRRHNVFGFPGVAEVVCNVTGDQYDPVYWRHRLGEVFLTGVSVTAPGESPVDWELGVLARHRVPEPFGRPKRKAGVKRKKEKTRDPLLLEFLLGGTPKLSNSALLAIWKESTAGAARAKFEAEFAGYFGKDPEEAQKKLLGKALRKRLGLKKVEKLLESVEE